MKQLIKNIVLLTTSLLINLFCYAQDGSLIITESTGINSASFITSDNAGNIYVLGSGKNIDFKNATVTSSSGLDDLYIAKMDSKGDWVWANTFGTEFNRYPYKITFGKDGNLYITGMFKQEMSIGSTTLKSTIGAGSSNAGFVAKLNTDGDWLWAVSLQSDNAETVELRSIAADVNGECYVTGHFTSKARLGSTTLTTATTNGSATLVARLSKDGKWIWGVNTISSDSYSGTRPHAISITSNQEVYIFGITVREVIFGKDTLRGSNGRHFIAGIDSSGEWIEAVSTEILGSSGPHDYGDMSIDQNNTIFLYI